MILPLASRKLPIRCRLFHFVYLSIREELRVVVLVRGT